MWHLVQYIQDRKYGIIEAFDPDLPPTRLCRDHFKGLFATHNLSKLTCIVPEEPDFDWSFNYWLDHAKVNILESFESDDPLTDLPNLFPEYYL